MRKWIAALLLLLVGTTLAACSATDKNSKTDMTSISTSLVTMTPTPTSTPVPTYAPGTKLYGMINVTGD
jgi:ABC-type glycerol-3-phosphate transport system substrate-binding protein